MEVTAGLQGFYNGILSLLFPKPCACCGRYIKKHEYVCVCPECYVNTRRIPDTLCKRCGKPVAANAEGECGECREQKKYFSFIRDTGIYEGALKELIYGLKFYSKKKIAAILAERIILSAGKEVFENADMIVPVPASELSERGREFNHTEVIAGKVSERTGIPFRKPVKKIKKTLPQNKLDRKSRLTNLKGAFESSGMVEGKTVIVLDDVYTTGATMNEMAKALIAAGAKEVRGIVTARSL